MGMSDEEGAKNTIAGLNRLKKIGEDHGGDYTASRLLNSTGGPQRLHV